MLSSFQSDSIPTTSFSPGEKSPSRGGATAQSRRGGCLLPGLVYSAKGSGPCLENIRGSGGAWEGCMMSLGMEKQSHV